MRYIIISAIGCSDFKAPINARVTVKDGIAVISCNSNDMTQTLHCNGVTWEKLEIKCDSGTHHWDTLLNVVYDI